MTDRYANMERQATLAAKQSAGAKRVHRCGCGHALQPIARKNGVEYYAGRCAECVQRAEQRSGE